MASYTLESRLFTLTVENQPTQIHTLIHRPHLPSSPMSTPRDGLSILLFPHWGGTARTYTPLQSDLASTHPHITTIALSYPGTGLSSSLPAGTPFSIATLTRTVLALLPQLRDASLLNPAVGIVLAGHSMGGKLALSLLPQLLNPQPKPDQQIRVHSILLIAPAPPGPLSLPADVRAGQMTAYASPTSAEAAIMNVLSHSPLPAAILEQLTQDAVDMSPGAKKGWIELGMSEDVRPPLKALASARPKPVRDLCVRVLVGREDRVETVERVRQETVGMLREAGFGDVSERVVDGCGHLMTVEAAEVVAEELRRLILLSDGAERDL